MKKTKAGKVAETVASLPAEFGLLPQMDLVFFRTNERQHHVYGPFLKVEDLPLDESTTGERGLYGTHTRGTELFAVSAPGGAGWRIVIEPIRGTWNARSQPLGAL